MKPQDFMDALGGIPQERLDALAKWQKSGTPLTGAEPETDNPARTGKLVITQKRNRTMKELRSATVWTQNVRTDNRKAGGIEQDE